MAMIYCGLDVHKDATPIAVLPADAAQVTSVDRLPSDLAMLQRYLARVARGGTLQVCDEASAAGFVVHRAVRAWG